MGCGVWNENTFRQYSKKNGRNVDKAGNIVGNMSNQEMFVSRSLDPMLNPKDVLRECCDNEEHPATVPVILALDVTGSMGQAAVEVAKRLNIIMTKLYQRVKDVEFMIMGIGDFAYDKTPLQVSQFESDIRIAEQLDKVYFEFGGGGYGFESYTAAWYFGVNHVKLDAWDRGAKGLIITMGDEGINPYLPGQALERVIGRRFDHDVETEELYQQACERYDLYHLFVKHENFRIYRHYIDSWKKFMKGEHLKVVEIDEIAKVIIDIVERHAKKENEESFLLGGQKKGLLGGFGKVELPDAAGGISW